MCWEVIVIHGFGCVLHEWIYSDDVGNGLIRLGTGMYD